MNNIDGPSLWRDVEHYKGECRSGSTLEVVPHLKINVISNTSLYIYMDAFLLLLKLPTPASLQIQKKIDCKLFAVDSNIA